MNLVSWPEGFAGFEMFVAMTSEPMLESLIGNFLLPLQRM
jgi:hypothetical protein